MEGEGRDDGAYHSIGITVHELHENGQILIGKNPLGPLSCSITLRYRLSSSNHSGIAVLESTFRAVQTRVTELLIIRVQLVPLNFVDRSKSNQEDEQDVREPGQGTIRFGFL